MKTLPVSAHCVNKPALVRSTVVLFDGGTRRPVRIFGEGLLQSVPPAGRAASEPAPCPRCPTSRPIKYGPASLVGRGVAMLAAEPDTRPDRTVDTMDLYPAEAPEVDIEELFDADGSIDRERWPDDPDAGTWELGPDPDGPEPSAADLAEAAEIFGGIDAQRHLDRSDRLTLEQLIEHQIAFYESWCNDAGKWFALHMAELLIKYRGAGSAPTPAEAMARIEILEQDVRHDWEARGYEEGLAAGRREGRGYNGPLD
jgi:hypothetical protein